MMKLTDFLKDVGIPFISVGTAVMVGILNYKISTNDQALRARDQQLTERIGNLDLLVKKAREERAERESNQNFNIKIYDIVAKSLEKGNPQEQKAAQAFVVVMVDEPLRSSLLNVLKQGGNPAIKANIGQILQQEEKFQSNVSIAPEKTREVTPTYNWGNWDFDIFWCSTSGKNAKQQAEAIGEQIVAEGAKGRIRIRELPESINAKSGYRVEGYAIRRNSDEEETAKALKRLAQNVLKTKGIQAEFNIGLTRQSTPWYISTFICPGS